MSALDRLPAEIRGRVREVVDTFAFQQGYEDARAGRPFAYPDMPDGLGFHRVALCQCNYEDGRLLAAVSPVLSADAFAGMILRGEVR